MNKDADVPCAAGTAAILRIMHARKRPACLPWLVSDRDVQAQGTALLEAKNKMRSRLGSTGIAGQGNPGDTLKLRMEIKKPAYKMRAKSNIGGVGGDK